MKALLRTDEFDQWLDNLRDGAARGRILQALDKLSLGLGDIQPVGEAVSELRLHFGPGYRVYFVEQAGAIMVLLCGGNKSSQSKDIKHAKEMRKRL